MAPLRTPAIPCALLVLAMTTAAAQDPRKAPIEQCSFTRLTSYDSLQAFLGRLDDLRGPIHVQRFATSHQGRALSCCFVSTPGDFGGDTSRLRVILFAQQHGDEPSGKEALTLLLAKAARHELDSLLSGIDLLVIPQMNPDGSELHQRRTADSVDLNRNHMLLTSPETKGLHDLFAAWWPHVTLDIHEYSPYSGSRSDPGLIKMADVQLGMLTNLNSSKALREFEHKEVYPFIAMAMRQGGFLFHEYIVGSPGETIRYSTTEPNDGRQSFGILNTLSFIQEGRGGREPEEGLEQRARSQLASVEALLSFCAAHAAGIRSLVNHERNALAEGRETSVVLRMDHFPGGPAMRIPLRLVPSGRDSSWPVHPLLGIVKPLCRRPLPSGYVVPRELSPIQELLERHHVRYEVAGSSRVVCTRVYRIDSVEPDTLEEEPHPKPAVRTETVEYALRPGDFVVPTHQRHGVFLAILLEPESMWGLVQYPGYESLLRPGTYPIFTIP